MNQEQQQIVDYLREENRVRAQILTRRLRLDDNQRRRLAVRPRPSGGEFCRTLLHDRDAGNPLPWHRKLIAEKYDGNVRRAPGRPGTPAE